MMKIIIFVLLLSVASVSYADIYVLTNAKGEVISVSDNDNAVVEKGMEKKVLPGNVKELGLTRDVKDYKLIGKTFIQDNDKISARENKRIKEEARGVDMNRIYQKSLRMACEKLVEEGEKLTQVKCNELE